MELDVRGGGWHLRARMGTSHRSFGGMYYQIGICRAHAQCFPICGCVSWIDCSCLTALTNPA